MSPEIEETEGAEEEPAGEAPRVPPRATIDLSTGRATWSPARAVAAALVVGLIASVLITYTSYQAEEERDDELFGSAVDQTALLLEKGFQQQRSVLRSLRGEVALEPADPEAFGDYVQSSSLIGASAGTTLVAWAPRVEAADVRELELVMRGAGYRDFEVSPPPASGEVAYPITFLAPARANESVRGFNLGADESGAASIETTTRTGDMSVGSPLTIAAPGGGERKAVNLYLATYEGGAVPPTQARSSELSGVALATVDVDQALDALLPDDTQVDVEVYDAGAAGAEARELLQTDLLADSNDSPFEGLEGGGRSERVELTFGGRTWELFFTPGPGFDPARALVRPWMIPFISMAVSTGVGLLLADVVRSRREVARQATALADEMTEYLRQREHELERANQEIIRSNKDLERYASIAAHDLQEPLRSLLAYASVLERRYGERLDEEVMDHVRRMARAAERMRSLVVDLLAYAKVDSATRTIELVDLNEAVRIALDDMSGLLQSTQATVRVGKLPKVPGNQRELIGVFSNLLSNALKYRSDDPPEVNIFCRRDGSYWKIGVQDNGIGIDPSYHDRIFELFRRLEKRPSDTGTGLGLAICARTVQQHGGQIWVESEEGQGSTFWFTLPAELNAPRAEAHAPPAEAST